MRKRVKAFVEQPYIITDEGHLDVLFKILMTGKILYIVYQIHSYISMGHVYLFELNVY